MRLRRAKGSRALVPAVVAVRPGPPAPVPPARPAQSALAGFLSPDTRRAYERDWKDFFSVEDLSRLSLERILAVGPEEVTAFRDRLLAAGMKPNSVTRKLSAVRSLYAYLVARGAVAVNPADPKLVRSPKRLGIQRTNPLSAGELRKILAAPDRSTPEGARDYAMFVLAAQAGLRRATLCNLKDENLGRYGDRPCVAFRGKGGKDHRVPLHRSVLEAVEAWRRVRPAGAAWLFVDKGGARVTESVFYKRLRGYAVRCGLEDPAVPGVRRPRGVGVHPHRMRAAYATILYEAGEDLKAIQELMGHARLETTLGYTRDADLARSSAPETIARAIMGEPPSPTSGAGSRRRLHPPSSP